MAQKPSIPKGTRDFSSAEVAKRNYIFSIIKSNFEKFGFQPIETPTFENSETLMGKYGEEGDRLIFKILNSGNYIDENSLEFLTSINDALDIFYKDTLLDNAYKENIVSCFDKYDKIKAFELIRDELLLMKNTIDHKLYEILNSFTFDLVETLVFLIKNKYFIEYIDKDLIDIERYKALNKLKLTICSKKLTPKISEKALRYDLTVPFARYVVQHQNELEFPFKRYQIQPVWRADRPQKGRFREFYQCDADVVGSNSLWQEVELVQLYDTVFTQLGLKGVTIKINNRKVLSGIAEVIGASDKLIDFTVALDKLDKIGEEGVKKEMFEKGITSEAIEKVQPLFNFTGTITEKIAQLAVLLMSSEEGTKGVKELQFICNAIDTLGLQSANFDLDVTLARGLNYYTGAIFEVAAPAGVAMGSIGGGGRYDDLTGIFGLKNMSGVGISFGLDRIYLVIEELGLFPETVTTKPQALFINFGDEEALYAMQAMAQLRAAGVRVELFPDKAKLDKQFKYAEKKGIPFVIFVGAEEMVNRTFKLKNNLTREEQIVHLAALTAALQ